MGIFDDDSSDEDNKNGSNSNNNNNPNLKDEPNDEEEDDPLELYMKTLTDDSTTTTTTPKSSNIKNNNTRLDIDNEEEATAHWVDNSSTNTGKENENDKSITSTKTLGDISFHRAGEKEQYYNNNNTANNNNNAYDDEDDEENPKRKKVIEPLGKLELSADSYYNNNKSQNAIMYDFLNATTADNNKNGSSSSEEVTLWRNTHGVTIRTHTKHPPPDPITSFEFITTKLKTTTKPILPSTFTNNETKSIIQTSLGYKSPTPVQAQCIPIILSGFDVLVTSQTGSGKTFAFLLPMFIHCTYNVIQKHYCNGLLFTPTRELAIQIYTQARIISNKIFKETNVLRIIGGDALSKWDIYQKITQQHQHIIISTPGRFMDVITSYKKIQPYLLCGVTQLVLDEADRMLEMGFEKQIHSIIQNLSSENCQKLFFSATFPTRIQNLAKQYLSNDFVRIAISSSSITSTASSSSTSTTSNNIEQYTILLPNQNAKYIWLSQMIPILSPLGKIIIFVSTKESCDTLCQQLQQQEQNRQINIVSLHGDKTQHERNTSLKSFKTTQSNSSSILIATDIASRGLDIPNVTTIINYDLPKNIQIYQHRIGRTGRMNAKSQQVQKGQAYTLFLKGNTKHCDFANLLLEYFQREGILTNGSTSSSDCYPELLSLAKGSRYFGNNSGSTSGKKRNFHGIGYN